VTVTAGTMPVHVVVTLGGTVDAAPVSVTREMDFAAVGETKSVEFTLEMEGHYRLTVTAEASNPYGRDTAEATVPEFDAGWPPEITLTVA